jgi:DNA-binding CsgD family transcriptional regulator
MVMVSRPDPHVYLALAKERFGLTPREVTVIQLLAKGLTNKEIAEKLAISEQTANEHLDHIRKKTRTKTRTGILGRVFALDPDIRGEAPSAIFYLQRDGIVDGQYDLASARRPAERNRAAIRGKHQAEKALHRYQSIHRRAGT